MFIVVPSQDICLLYVLAYGIEGSKIQSRSKPGSEGGGYGSSPETACNVGRVAYILPTGGKR